jgi:hypothetical protein
MQYGDGMHQRPFKLQPATPLQPLLQSFAPAPFSGSELESCSVTFVFDRDTISCAQDITLKRSIAVRRSFHLTIWLLHVLHRNCDPVSHELRFAQNKGILQRWHNAIPLHHRLDKGEIGRSTALYPLASWKSLLEVADPKGDLPHSSLAPISMVVWSLFIASRPSFMRTSDSYFLSGIFK